jgi:hypothetical protein
MIVVGETMKKLKPIEVVGDVCLVPLSKGKVAVVDIADRHLVEGFNWFASQTKAGGAFYAVRNRPSPDRGLIYMHRVIFGPGLADHKDRDTMNNRRSNLRSATPGQNICNSTIRRDNTSGSKNVTWNAKRKLWQVQIAREKGKSRPVGHFADKEQACLFAAEQRRIYYGEFSGVE